MHLYSIFISHYFIQYILLVILSNRTPTMESILFLHEITWHIIKHIPIADKYLDATHTPTNVVKGN